MALEVEDEQIVWPGGSRLAVETMIMRMAPIFMMALKIMRMKMTVPMIMRMTMSALMIMLMTTKRKNNNNNNDNIEGNTDNNKKEADSYHLQ